MIELKNIRKTYQSKKKNVTQALNGVSLKFPDRGMVFILGKSGSGKSTLLNIIGGLDQYDSGDMIILNKSTKDFSQADFDSYRNTYIGFVFQDFNILEDYNVYENIVLALQLQQKPVEEQTVDQLLEKLELKELKKRKVNELSGGQKQRVAIARALVKNPKIILADEPTGNLDSATGQQVMELLKEISREKLVIIVSHDREFAQTYGDRIIEIQDGNIIQDTKEQAIETDSQNYRTIPSKLPLKESFKLGLGSLKHKKIKLLFTVLLTMCTLLFLSIMDSLSGYNIEKAHAKLLADKNEQFLQIEKYRYEKFDKYDFVNKEKLALTDTDLADIKKKIDQNGYPIYRLQEEYSPLNIEDLLKIKQSSNEIPYVNLYETADIVVIDNVTAILKEKIIGKLPTNADEIVISNYLADLIIQNGITEEGDPTDEFMTENIYKPKDYHELLNANKVFYFGSTGRIKIVGIIDYDLSLYQDIKEKEYKNYSEENHQQYSNLITNYKNIYNKIYVNSSFIDNLKVKKVPTLNSNNNYHLITNDLTLQNEGYYIAPAVLEEETEYYDGTEWHTIDRLSKNEMLLNIQHLKDFDRQNYQKNLSSYLDNHPEEDKNTLEKKFFENYVKEYDVIGKSLDLEIHEGRSYESDNPDYQYKNIKIIGLVGLENKEKRQYNYFSADLVNHFKVNPLQKIGYLIPVTEEKVFKNILENFPYHETLSAKSTYSEDVNGLVRTVFILKDIAFWVSLVLLVFTVFLIGNFMITSIHYRKKEIGVLRAVGSRSIDIVKIFLWEGIVMSLISGTLASILLVFVTNLLNRMMMSGTSLILTPFILSMRQFVVVYAIVFAVTVVSSILPLIKISRMKPIDAILNK